MTAKFIQTGDAVDYTPDADVKAGDVVVQGELVGVAKLDIQTGKLGALALRGVFEFPKATGTSLAVGTRLYWDHDENVVRTDSDSGEYQALGLTVKAAAETDAAVRVRMTHFEAQKYQFPT